MNPQGDLYVPVTYTFWSALATISPRHAPDSEGYTLSPAVFHLANVAMHALAAIVVWQILRRLVNRDWPALIGAAIFAVHPVQVETVGWISGGKDVLSGLLGLVAIWMYLRFLDPFRPRRSYNLATLAFIAATLAKPQAVAIPLVAFVIDWLLVRRNAIASIKSLTLWFAWCIPVILIGQHVQSAQLLDSPIWFRPVVVARCAGVLSGQDSLAARARGGLQPKSELASGVAGSILDMGHPGCGGDRLHPVSAPRAMGGCCAIGLCCSTAAGVGAGAV